MATAGRRSKWLRSAVVDSEGLHVPGRPARHAVELCLGPAGVRLRAGSSVTWLPWDDFGHEDDRRPGPGGGCWWVTHFARGRHGSFGVALGVGDAAVARTEVVRDEVATWRNRLHRLTTWEPYVPLWATPHSTAPRERGTLTALCWVLARRPELRERLADVQRTAALAEAMAARPLPLGPEPAGLRRGTFEVLGALRSLGHRHMVERRPLPGAPLPTLDEIVDDVLARLRRNPSTRDLEIGREDVERLARRHFFDIEPWPFEALLA